MSHAALRERSKANQAKKISSVGTHDRQADKKMIERAMRQHESHDHPGQPKTKLKLASGGAAVDGDMAKPRLDRPSKSPKKSGKGAHVNVIVANAPREKEPMPVPVPAMGAPKPPVAPPPGPMPVAGGPPGMPPRPPMPIAAAPGPMMPRRSGGRATYAKGGAVMDAGSKSGKGRLEKIALQKRDDAIDKKKERAEGGEFKRGGKAC